MFACNTDLHIGSNALVLMSNNSLQGQSDIFFIKLMTLMKAWFQYNGFVGKNVYITI